MKRVVTGIFFGAGLFLFGASAFGQDHGRPGMSFQDRDRYWGHDRMAREWRGAFYDHLQADLSRAQRSRYLRGDDLGRFDRAHREVGQFSAKWERGVFDPREMDQAIASVQRVVDIPSLRRDDRDLLREDLRRMRDFRGRM